MALVDVVERVTAALDHIGARRSGSIVALRSRGEHATIGHGTDALGRRGDAGSVLPLYCLVKPVLARVTAQAVTARELSLDDQLGDLIAVGEASRNATVLDVLEHRSGIVGPHGIDAGLLDATQRRQLLRGAHDPPGAQVHYSEVLAFEALGWSVAEALGTDLEDLLPTDGLWFGRTAHDLDVGSVWVSGLQDDEGETYPILFGLSRKARSDSNPGFGGYARPTAYLDAVDTWIEEADAVGFTAAARFDTGLDRMVGWGHGLCTSMSSELGLDRAGLVGHLGFMSSSCYVYDRASGIGVVAALTPIVRDVAESRRLLGEIVAAALAP